VPEKTSPANKIVASMKGLRNQLQTEEQPLLTIPGIWDNGQQQHSTMCDVILTNQRIFGYIYKTFPRESLFLDAQNIAEITRVELRQKEHEPLFRELLIETGTRKVYVRAPRKKIEVLYTELQKLTNITPTNTVMSDTTGTSIAAPPSYSQQQIRGSFENSALAIMLLFVGGILLEIFGVLLISVTHNAQSGIFLCFAGFVAVITSIMLRRRRSKGSR
jgi:hypothetical protein